MALRRLERHFAIEKIAKWRQRAPMPAVQVSPEHYTFERYDNHWRWFSYWYQIRSAMRVAPKRVLEIGTGSGAFRAYLQAQGIDVLSADIDKTRGVDFVADVSRLDDTLPAGERFDLIAACQVLEHLPYEQFDASLEGIARRADPYALITLPYRGWRFHVRVGFDEWALNVGGRIPKPYPYKFNGQHYWELGWKYPVRKITKAIKRHFDVIEQFTIKENAYHYLWLLHSKYA